MSGMKKKIKIPTPKGMTLEQIAKHLHENQDKIGDFSLYWFDKDDCLNVVGSTTQDQTCRISVAAQINGQKAMLGAAIRE